MCASGGEEGKRGRGKGEGKRGRGKGGRVGFWPLVFLLLASKYFFSFPAELGRFHARFIIISPVIPFCRLVLESSTTY